MTTQPWQKEVLRRSDLQPEKARQAMRKKRLAKEEEGLTQLKGELDKLAPDHGLVLIEPPSAGASWTLWNEETEVLIRFEYSDPHWTPGQCSGLKLKAQRPSYKSDIRSLGRTYKYDFDKGRCPSTDKLAKTLRTFQGRVRAYLKIQADIAAAKKATEGAVRPVLEEAGYTVEDVWGDVLKVSEGDEELIRLKPTGNYLMSDRGVPIQMTVNNAPLVMAAIKALRKAMEME